MNVAVVYKSRFGESASIVADVVAWVRAAGHTADVVRAGAASPAALERYDAFVLVTPVHFSNHFRGMRRFAQAHARLLAARPCAIVVVGHADPDRIERTLLSRSAVSLAPIQPIHRIVTSADRYHEPLAELLGAPHAAQAA